ncbi:MAG: DUF2807 domain-containing protein [Bacteroidales bacterium]
MKTKVKIKKIVLMAGILLLAGLNALNAQTTENKKVLPEFTGIVVKTPIRVNLIQRTECSVSVEKGNIEDILKYQVKDNILYIEKGTIDDITITFSKINKIDLSRACKLKSLNQINAEKLDIYMNGSSEMDIDINVKSLNSYIDGPCTAKYKGVAKAHSIEAGGAEVNAFDLITDSSKVQINRTGNVNVNVKQYLKGIIYGDGELTYLNEPAFKDIKVDSEGSYGLKGADKIKIKGTSDTTRFKIGDYKVLLIKDTVGGEKRDTTKDKDKNKDKVKIYWAGFGMGVNGYLNANNETKVLTGYDFLELNYPKSINVSLNFWEENIPIWKKHINIVTGMGVDISNYRFASKNYSLLPDSNYISADYDSTGSIKKNKLAVTYLNMPLLLQLDTKPFGKKKRTLHISGGIVGGVRLWSHVKDVAEISGTDHKSKIKDDFNLNPFRYSAMVRLGYGKWDVYASYSLNTLFKKNEGPQLYPFTVGITLLGL